MPARDKGDGLLQPLYRSSVPISWVRQDPIGSITDTTEANCTFFILEGEEKVKITFHTFPIENDEIRIPPEAQIARWKRQLEKGDPLQLILQPVSQGGFSGLFFEGEGEMKGKQTKVLGWSMKLADEYLRKLKIDSPMRADFTIKAVGTPLMIDKHRTAIIHFASHFELIDELPPLYD